MSVVCQINFVGGITWPTRMLKVFWGTKGKKRSPDTDDYEKQRLATLKRLKRGEVDLRLEKVVASKQLRLAVETEEERRTRLEAFLKSWQLCLSFKLDVLTT